MRKHWSFLPLSAVSASFSFVPAASWVAHSHRMMRNVLCPLTLPSFSRLNPRMFSQKNAPPSLGLSPAAGLVLVITGGAGDDHDSSAQPPTKHGTHTCATVFPPHPSSCSSHSSRGTCWRGKAMTHSGTSTGGWLTHLGN